MKTTKYLIAAAFLATGLFAGCKKGDSSYGVAANDKVMGPTANITFQVQTVPQRPGYMLQWNSGSLITSKIIFNGTILNGNVGELMTFDAPALKTIDLTKSSLTTLGSVNVAYEKYLRASFAADIDPINSVTSLVLQGYFYPVPPPSGVAPFSPIPIEIAISTHAVLNSVMLSNLLINKSNYVATLSLDVNQLTSGISPFMLTTATITNGTILIDNESNPELFGIVVKNLENYMINVQLSAQLMNTVSNPVQ